MTFKERKDHKSYQKVHENGRIIGMICNAGHAGISSGIVKGRKTTGSRRIKDDLENAGE